MALRIFGRGRPQDSTTDAADASSPPPITAAPPATETAAPATPDAAPAPEADADADAPAKGRRSTRSTEPVQGDISPSDFPEEATRRRRRRRSRGRGTNGDAPADEATTTPAPVEESPAAAESPEGADAPSTSSRRRRSRGKRSGDTAVEPAVVVAAELETAPPSPPPASRAPAARKPASSGGQGRDAEHLFSMLENLVARQNVILETFAQRQLSAIRSIENSVLSMGQAGYAGSGVGGAAPRVGIFVDVPNIIYAAERLGVVINFGKVLRRLTEGRSLVRASAYAPISDDPQARLEQQKFVQPFVNFGYRIVTKPFKRFADGSIKGNFDVELAMDVLTMSERLDVVSLVSGDGDFRRLCELVASKGVRVEVVAFGTSTASELRAVADDYVDLADQLEDLAD